MSDRVVELIRRFAPMSVHGSQWDGLFDAGKKPERWFELETHQRILIIADPGAGKTFEAQDRTRRIRARGANAFFIRIEAIDVNFETAFEIGTAEEFEGWLASTEEAWFFLDSVDEAQLETPSALEQAIRTFGDRIFEARERARIVIASREDAWEALPDRTVIDQYLPSGAPPPAEPTGDQAGGGGLKVYRLLGLTEDEICLFASHYGVSDTVAFLAAIQRRGLMGLAACPFDLKALILVWTADTALGSRFEALQRMIELQLAPLGRIRGGVVIDGARAREAVRILAGAVLLTGLVKLGLPGAAAAPELIDPSALLPGWSADELDALLRTGVFDDVVYSSVRFRHREIRELLGAEWAHGLLQQPDGRTEIEALFFRDSYGEAIIVPRTRVVLPWLILMDEGVRDRALALAPEVASEGGDPSRLPLEVRRTMLVDLVEKIASGERE